MPEDGDPRRDQAAVEVASAFVRAARKLRLESLLLRMVAAELPDNPWLSDLQIGDAASSVLVKTLHLCPPECELNPIRCLTALKVEDSLSKSRRRPYITSSLSAVGPYLEITLRTLHPES